MQVPSIGICCLAYTAACIDYEQTAGLSIGAAPSHAQCLGQRLMRPCTDGDNTLMKMQKQSLVCVSSFCSILPVMWLQGCSGQGCLNASTDDVSAWQLPSRHIRQQQWLGSSRAK